MNAKKSLMLALSFLIIASLACTIDLGTSPQPQAPAPVQTTDVCKNIDGAQQTVPSGFTVDVAGNCTQTPVEPQVTDVCKNIEGVQSTVPSGFTVDTAGNCTVIPPEPPVVNDVCKNIEGVQSTVPSGFTVDTAGNCTVIPPPVPQKPTATAKEALDCRAYPTFDANAMGGIPMGTTVEVLGQNPINSQWYLVKWPGYTCWVYSQFVTINGDAASIPIVAVTIPENPVTGMTFTITNNTPFKLCRLALHGAGGGGLLRWWEPGKGNWDPGETATFIFPLKPGRYDVYVYKCNGALAEDPTPNFKLVDGGSYQVP